MRAYVWYTFLRPLSVVRSGARVKRTSTPSPDLHFVGILYDEMPELCQISLGLRRLEPQAGIWKQYQIQQRAYTRRTFKREESVLFLLRGIAPIKSSYVLYTKNSLPCHKHCNRSVRYPPRCIPAKSCLPSTEFEHTLPALPPIRQLCGSFILIRYKRPCIVHKVSQAPPPPQARNTNHDAFMLFVSSFATPLIEFIAAGKQRAQASATNCPHTPS